MKIRIVKTNIEQFKNIFSTRYFVEVLNGDTIHDMRNFETEKEALMYKSYLIATNFSEVSI